MDMKLRTLSPVHIGSGKDIEPFDYVTRDGLYSRVDLDAFAERLIELNPEYISQFSEWITETSERIDELEDQRKRHRNRMREFQNELNQVRANFTLAYFAREVINAPELADGLMTDDSLAHYRCAINSDRQYQLKEQTKTANNEFYVPGSSLKGVIRTALAFAVISEADEAFKKRLRNRLVRYPDEARQLKQQRKFRELNRLESQLGNEIEDAIFRCGTERRDRVTFSEIHFDLMRAIQVSDTFDAQAKLGVLMSSTFLRKVDRNNPKSTPQLDAQVPVLLETLLPQSQFSIRLTTDLGFVRRAQAGVLGEWLELDERFERLFGFSRTDLQTMDDKTAEDRTVNRILNVCASFSNAIVQEEKRWAEQFERRGTERILSFYDHLTQLSDCTPVRLGWGSHYMATSVVLAMRGDAVLGDVMTDIVRAFEVDLTWNMRGKAGDPKTRTVRLETFPRSRRMAALGRSAGAPYGWVALSDPSVALGDALIDVDELTKLYRSQRTERGGQRPGQTILEPKDTVRSQGAMQDALKGLKKLQDQATKEGDAKRGEKINAVVVSNDGRNVVVKLVDHGDLELKFQRPYYHQKAGARIKVKVNQVDDSTGKILKVIP